jgi:hypothetical protein
LRTFGGILLSVLLIGGVAYAIFGDIHVGPSADAQKPVALACLKRAGFEVADEVPTGAFTSLYPSGGRDVQWELDVKDKDGTRVAVMYLADMPGDLDEFADHLKDKQKTYGDYKDEAIEHRGTTVIRLVKGYPRADAINQCVDRAAKAKET